MNTVELIGVEQVQRAARTMADAAESMSRTATNIDGSLERHQRFLDDWLTRFQEILEMER